MEVERQTARQRFQPILVGRKEELAALWELALRGRHTLLTGPAGVGKTALLNTLFRGLKAQGTRHVFRMGDVRQFKTSLVQLAEQLHEQHLFRHPTLRSSVVAALPWQKLAAKVRLLTIKQLAEALVLSLTGRNAVLIWDDFDSATPTRLAWTHAFLDTATLIVASTDPHSRKLKPILDRIPAKVQLNPLSQEETCQLIDRCLEVAPFAISHPDWYRREVWRNSQGIPRAIKDLLADHSLEKQVDVQLIRNMQSEQSARYFPISWVVLVAMIGFSIHRYVGRGLGDRDAYIIGAVGMVVFLALWMFVRKANQP